MRKFFRNLSATLQETRPVRLITAVERLIRMQANLADRIQDAYKLELYGIDRTELDIWLSVHHSGELRLHHLQRLKNLGIDVPTISLRTPEGDFTHEFTDQTRRPAWWRPPVLRPIGTSLGEARRIARFHGEADITQEVPDHDKLPPQTRITEDRTQGGHL